MSIYVPGPNWTWENYLQGKSYENSINGQIAKSSREIIATSEQLQSEQIEVAHETNAAITAGFEEVSWRLDNIRQGIGEINATLNWGFSSMLLSLGRISDSLEELKRIAQTPAQSSAQEWFNTARRAFTQGWHEEALKSIDKALNGCGGQPGYDLDFHFHFLLGLIRLGDVKNQSGDIIDLAAAEKSFLLSAKYAEPDDKREAARGMLCAGWAAYCNSAFTCAIEHTNKAIRLNPQLGEAHFQLAKILMHTNRPADALPPLAKAVRLDKNYMPKADMDGDFQQHQTKVDQLFEILRKEARDLADRHFAAAKDKMTKLEEIDVGGFQLCQYAVQPMNEARTRLQSAGNEASKNTYFGYINAVCICERAAPSFSKAIYEFKEVANKDITGRMAIEKQNIKKFRQSYWVTYKWCGIILAILIASWGIYWFPNQMIMQALAGVFCGAIFSFAFALIITPLWHYPTNVSHDSALAKLDLIRRQILSVEPF